MNVQLVSAGKAATTTHGDTDNSHDGDEDQAEENLYPHRLPQPFPQQNAADDPSRDAAKKSGHWRDIALRETK